MEEMYTISSDVSILQNLSAAPNPYFESDDESDNAESSTVFYII